MSKASIHKKNDSSTINSQNSKSIFLQLKSEKPTSLKDLIRGKGKK